MLSGAWPARLRIDRTGLCVDRRSKPATSQEADTVGFFRKSRMSPYIRLGERFYEYSLTRPRREREAANAWALSVRDRSQAQQGGLGDPETTRAKLKTGFDRCLDRRLAD